MEGSPFEEQCSENACDEAGYVYMGYGSENVTALMSRALGCPSYLASLVASDNVTEDETYLLTTVMTPFGSVFGNGSTVANVPAVPASILTRSGMAPIAEMPTGSQIVAPPALATASCRVGYAVTSFSAEPPPPPPPASSSTLYMQSSMGCQGVMPIDCFANPWNAATDASGNLALLSSSTNPDCLKFFGPFVQALPSSESAFSSVVLGYVIGTPQKALILLGGAAGGGTTVREAARPLRL